MFRSFMRAACVSALAIAAVPAAASSVFSSYFVFGDSLSDNGNLFAATGQPPAPYDSGRFSNGPVWNEYVMAQFGAEGKVAANFAFGGAKARTDMDGIPDLAAQLALFAANVPKPVLGKRPLATLWFGANDLLNPTGGNDVGTAVKSIGNAIKTLGKEHGIRDFLVLNLPNLGVTPRSTAQGTLPADHPQVLGATGASAFYNAQLAAELAGLTTPGRRIMLLDTFGVSTQLGLNPSSVDPRLTNVGQSCIVTGVSVCDLATEGVNRVFFDEIHPNFVVHEVLGGQALTQVNTVAPIPLPAPLALLGAALFGLGALRRSRRTA